MGVRKDTVHELASDLLRRGKAWVLVTRKNIYV